MIIAGNDEAKRSKIWRVVTLVSSALIILIAVYLLTRMFTTNPVVGNWESEDATIALKIEKNDTIQVDITDIAENTDAAVEMNYSVDMKSKIITITKDEEQIDKAVEKADGAYTKEDLENVLDDLDSSFFIQHRWQSDDAYRTRIWGTVHVHQKVGIRQRNLKRKYQKICRVAGFSACEGAKIMYRDHTKEVQIGNVTIGGGNPIRIQSMTNTKTEDVEATVAQILALEKAGCEIIRCAVPNMDAAKAIGEIKKQIHIPLVADIHFDYKLAIAAIENGADKIRINPGNIGDEKRVRAVVEKCKRVRCSNSCWCE